MGRPKGSSVGTKAVKSSTAAKDPPVVGTHGYTTEETEAAFFLFMEQQKEKEPGLKLSGAVAYWNALATTEKKEFRQRARLLFQSYAASREKDGRDEEARVETEDGADVGLEVGVRAETGTSSGVIDEFAEGRARKRSRENPDDEYPLPMAAGFVNSGGGSSSVT